MTQIETSVYEKTDEGIIGAEVIVYNEGEEIDSIQIVDSTELAELEAKLDVIDETYVQYAEDSSLIGSTLDSILANTGEDVDINATTLSGFSSDDFSKTNHTHNTVTWTASNSNFNTAFVDTSTGNTNWLRYARLGQIATVSFYLTLKNTITTTENTIVSNIPLAFRPAGGHAVNEMVFGTNGLQFKIQLNGEYVKLRHYSSGAHSGIIIGTLSFYCMGD